jgi:cellulose synthase/poly-beta-1,6-N-acetylglucosamine synthase-like glycosyltransferase
LPPATTSRTVSIVLVSHGDASAIRERLVDLLATNYPPEQIEVIVALDAARTRASVNDLNHLDHRVKVLHGDAPGGKAAALNAGVRAATHDIVVFADTAQSYDPDAIGILVDALEDERLGAVSGALVLPKGPGSPTPVELYWRYERWLRRMEARVHSSVGVTGAIYAMRRSTWQPVPSGLILDDLFTPMRLVLEGWRIGFAVNAVARDSRRTTPDTEYQRKVRTLTGVIQLCFWLPAILNPLRNPIWVQFICHKILRLLTPYLMLVVIVAGGWRAAQLMLSSGNILYALIAVGALVVTLTIPRPRRAVFEQFSWFMALQGAFVGAAVNGLRRRWDVWR